MLAKFFNIYSVMPLVGCEKEHLVSQKCHFTCA